MERVDVEQRAEKARRFFLEGYNCAQAVVLAYCDLFDISPSLAASISAPLGGGMGRLREVYSTVQDLAEKSKALNGSIICRELLGLDHKSDSPTPEARTETYYKRRPCADYVASAARLIGEKLNEVSEEM